MSIPRGIQVSSQDWPVVVLAAAGLFVSGIGAGTNARESLGEMEPRMTDEDLDAFFAQHIKTDEDQVIALKLSADLNKLAPLFADEATRADVERQLDEWQVFGGPLRKGMAAAWLQRARGAIAAGAEKAGNLGAKAGAAIEPHLPAGRDMRDVARGVKANPSTEAGKKMEADATDYGERTAAAAERLRTKLAPRAEAQRQADLHAGRGGRSVASDARQSKAASLHQDWMTAGARESRQRSIAGHQNAYARMGRTAAKFGFKAGLAAAGAGAAGAAVHAMSGLSEAERDERVKAARSRWSHSKRAASKAAEGAAG